MGELALPLIGMALSTGGSYLNGLQQQQYIEAQAKAEQDAYRVSKQAREAEQGRQKVFSDEAQRYLADTQRQVTPEATAANQDEAVQRFMKVYDERGSSQPEGQYLSGQENATELIRSEIAKRAATSAADARSRVKALAKVGSFDAAMASNGQALQTGGQNLNVLGGLRRGSLATGQQEQSIAPQQVYPGDNLLGPLMQAGGSLASGLGGTAGGFGGYTVDAATGVPTQNWGWLSGLVNGQNKGII